MLSELMAQLIIPNKYIMKRKHFYYSVLIILFCSSCAAKINTNRYYEGICILYGRPEIYLEVLKNGNFTYRFRYAPKTISGRWKVHKDTLILESPSFSLEKSVMQMVKNTNIDGKDAYIIKGKKLYALDSNNNLIKKCHLKLSKKSQVNLENY